MRAGHETSPFAFGTRRAAQARAVFGRVESVGVPNALEI
jgi:hypothetical protein